MYPGVTTEECWRDGRDSKPSATSPTESNLDDSRETPIVRYAKLIGVSLADLQTVTPGVTAALAADLRRVTEALRSGRIADLPSGAYARLAAAVEVAAAAADAQREGSAGRPS